MTLVSSRAAVSSADNHHDASTIQTARASSTVSSPPLPSGTASSSRRVGSLLSASRRYVSVLVLVAIAVTWQRNGGRPLLHRPVRGTGATIDVVANEQDRDDHDDHGDVRRGGLSNGPSPLIDGATDFAVPAAPRLGPPATPAATTAVTSTLPMVGDDADVGDGPLPPARGRPGTLDDAPSDGRPGVGRRGGGEVPPMASSPASVRLYHRRDDDDGRTLRRGMTGNERDDCDVRQLPFRPAYYDHAAVTAASPSAAVDDDGTTAETERVRIDAPMRRSAAKSNRVPRSLRSNKVSDRTYWNHVEPQEVGFPVIRTSTDCLSPPFLMSLTQLRVSLCPASRFRPTRAFAARTQALAMLLRRRRSVDYAGPHPRDDANFALFYGRDREPQTMPTWWRPSVHCDMVPTHVAYFTDARAVGYCPEWKHVRFGRRLTRALLRKTLADFLSERRATREKQLHRRGGAESKLRDARRCDPTDFFDTDGTTADARSPMSPPTNETTLNDAKPTLSLRYHKWAWLPAMLRELPARPAEPRRPAPASVARRLALRGDSRRPPPSNPLPPHGGRVLIEYNCSSLHMNQQCRAPHPGDGFYWRLLPSPTVTGGGEVAESDLAEVTAIAVSTVPGDVTAPPPRPGAQVGQGPTYKSNCLNAETFAPTHTVALEHVDCVMETGGPLLAMALLHFISDEGRRPIVFIGDSMTRHVFNRLVQHLRFGGVSVDSAGPFVPSIPPRHGGGVPSENEEDVAAVGVDDGNETGGALHGGDTGGEHRLRLVTTSDPACVFRGTAQQNAQRRQQTPLSPLLGPAFERGVPMLRWAVEGGDRSPRNGPTGTPSILSVLPSELPPSFTDVPYYESDRYARHRYYVLRGSIDEYRQFPDATSAGLRDMQLPPDCRPRRTLLDERKGGGGGRDDGGASPPASAAAKVVFNEKTGAPTTTTMSEGRLYSASSVASTVTLQNDAADESAAAGEDDCFFMLQFVWAPAEKNLHLATLLHRSVKPHDTTAAGLDGGGEVLLVGEPAMKSPSLQSTTSKTDGVPSDECAASQTRRRATRVPMRRTRDARPLPVTLVPSLLVAGFHYWSTIPGHQAGVNALGATEMTSATNAWFDMLRDIQDGVKQLTWLRAADVVVAPRREHDDADNDSPDFVTIVAANRNHSRSRSNASTKLCNGGAHGTKGGTPPRGGEEHEPPSEWGPTPPRSNRQHGRQVDENKKGKEGSEDEGDAEAEEQQQRNPDEGRRSSTGLHYLQLTTPRRFGALEEVVAARQAASEACVTAFNFEEAKWATQPLRRQSRSSLPPENDVDASRLTVRSSLRLESTRRVAGGSSSRSMGFVDMRAMVDTFPPHLQRAMWEVGMDGHFQCMFASSREVREPTLYESGVKCRDDANGGVVRVLLNDLAERIVAQHDGEQRGH